VSSVVDVHETHVYLLIAEFVHPNLRDATRRPLNQGGYGIAFSLGVTDAIRL